MRRNDCGHLCASAGFEKALAKRPSALLAASLATGLLWASPPCGLSARLSLCRRTGGDGEDPPGGGASDRLDRQGA